jgi:hypothetical protein
LSISQADAERLSAAGFLPSEIFALAEAKTVTGKDQPPVNLDSASWKSALETRYKWWQNKYKRGWTTEEIENSLLNYYARDVRRTPFDFLRAEYKPPKKTDYFETLRKRQEAQLSGELTGYKTRRFRGV